MTPLTIFAPAKLNLFLAITGRRADGFHNLVSVAVQLDFGDTLHLTPAESFSLACDAPDVPVDESNLVLRAAHAFAAATDWRGGGAFRLEKRIPMGAGLGGGSSNAVAALKGLNVLAGNPLGREGLLEVAAGLGSDCPLFLHEGPVVMRGRGERLEGLPAAAAERLRGQRVLVFKPGFGIATPWAYGQLVAAAPGGYLPPEQAEERLAAWLRDPEATLEALGFNNMEPPAFRKFVALPVLLEELRRGFGLKARMSGSGSACYAFLHDQDPAPVTAAIREAWGESANVIATRVL